MQRPSLGLYVLKARGTCSKHVVFVHTRSGAHMPNSNTNTLTNFGHLAFAVLEGLGSSLKERCILLHVTAMF